MIRSLSRRTSRRKSRRKGGKNRRFKKGKRKYGGSPDSPYLDDLRHSQNGNEHTNMIIEDAR